MFGIYKLFKAIQLKQFHWEIVQLIWNLIVMPCFMSLSFDEDKDKQETKRFKIYQLFLDSHHMSLAKPDSTGGHVAIRSCQFLVYVYPVRDHYRHFTEFIKIFWDCSDHVKDFETSHKMTVAQKTHKCARNKKPPCNFESFCCCSIVSPMILCHLNYMRFRI